MKEIEVLAKLPTRGSFPFIVYEEQDRYISQRIQKRGSWEPFETRIMQSILNKGDSLVDIGANIGWYTISMALHIGVSGDIYAFEPDPDNADLLQKNVVLNNLRNVHIFKCALSDKTGTMQFLKSVDNMGDHRLCTYDTGSPTIDVPVDTLDRLLDTGKLNISKVRIVKIDTQGAEVFVMSGGERTIALLPEDCSLFIEFSPNLLRKHQKDFPDRFLRFIRTMNKDIYAVNARYRTIYPISLIELEEFALTCGDRADDTAIDLIITSRSNKKLKRFCRFYGTWVKKMALPISHNNR